MMTRKTAAKWLEMDPIHYDMIGDNVAEAYIYDSDFEDGLIWQEVGSTLWHWEAGFDGGIENTFDAARRKAERALREDADFEYDPSGDSFI